MSLFGLSSFTTSNNSLSTFAATGFGTAQPLPAPSTSANTNVDLTSGLPGNSSTSSLAGQILGGLGLA